MGHYDEQYEMQYRIDERNRREDLLRWIKENIEEMNNAQLEMVYNVSESPDDYNTFFRILRGRR